MAKVRGQITITNVNDGTPGRGAYIVQEDQSFLIRETAGGLSALPEGGGYIEAVKGNTVAWNQVFVLRNGGNISWSNNVGTVVSNADTYFSMTSVSGHKYVFRVYVSLVGHASFGIPSQGQNQKELQNGWNSWLFTGRENSSSATFDDGNRSEDTTGTQFSNMQLFDLTLIYGSGNEPTTVKQFEADYLGWFDKPLSYEPYDAGSLIPVRMSGLKSVGFNLWDEEWELGNINGNTGANQDSTNRIRSKNYIKVICGANYYFRGPINTNIRIVYYDESKNVISAIDSNDSEFTTPNNAFYMRFVYGSGAAPYTSYNHDICINLSNDSLNGIYKPYSENRAALPITSLTGRLNGTGSSVTVFPDGLKKAGSVYDEIYVENGVTKAIKRVGSVDLGSITWLGANDVGVTYAKGTFITFGLPSIKDATSNIACNFYEEIPSIGYNALSPSSYEKVIACYGNDNRPIIKDSALIGKSQSQVQTYLSGTIFYYELTEPQTYIIDNALLPSIYSVKPGGTEEIITSMLTAKPTLKLLYGVSAEYMNAKAVHVKDGEDALALALSPTTAIFSLSEESPYAIIVPSGGYVINVLASLGETSITNEITIGTPIPSKIIVNNAEQNICTYTVNNTDKQIKITSIRNDISQGTITIPVNYNNVTRNLIFSLYCNLLGTWKQSVVNDAETIAAKKVVYELSALLVLTKTSNEYTSLRDSTQNLESWKTTTLSTIKGHATSINNLNTRLSTAEENINTVSSALDGKASTSYVNLTANIIELSVSHYYNGLDSKITQTAESLTSLLSNKVNTSTFNLTANSFNSSINSINGNVSTLQQTVNSIKSEVFDNLGNSKIELTANRIATTVANNKFAQIDGEYKITKLVDASHLNNDYFYPVSLNLQGVGSGSIFCRVLRPLDKHFGEYITESSNSGYRQPTYANHSNGVLVNLEWSTIAGNWGTRTIASNWGYTDDVRIISDYTINWDKSTSTVPSNYIVGSIGQITERSKEIVYVRGGSKYLISCSKDVDIELHSGGLSEYLSETKESRYRNVITSFNNLVVPRKDTMSKSLILQTADSIRLEVSDSLYSTGIDIASGKITAQANKFEIKNSSGTTTMSVDSEGNLVTKGSASINGKITATGGTIGGFNISGNSLYSGGKTVYQDTNNPTYSTSRVTIEDDMGTTSYLGLLFGSDGDNLKYKEAARFEATTKTNNILRNVAVRLTAMHGTLNFAFKGEGNGLLEGWICGYTYEILEFSSIIKTIDLNMGELKNLLKTTISGCTAKLPNLGNVRYWTATGSGVHFAIPYYIYGDFNNSLNITITGHNSDSDCPYIINTNGTIVNSVSLSKGQTYEFLLMYDSNNYSYPYTARIVSKT